MVPVLIKDVRRLLFREERVNCHLRKQIFCDIFLIISIYLKFYEIMSNPLHEIGLKQ